MKINYEDLIKYHDIIISYAMKTCESFSLITNQKRPHSKTPPNSDSENVILALQPYLLKQITGVRAWPAGGTKSNHKIISFYHCNKYCCADLLKLGDFFSPIDNKLPEDICFYRDNIAWLVTVSHERYGFMFFPSKSDIDFLDVNAIKYFNNHEDIKYYILYTIN
jgi:hypothetical protein